MIRQAFALPQNTEVDASDLFNTHSDTHTNAQTEPSSIIFHFLLLSLYFPLLHAIHLSFAISICSNEIYLASGECPSAMRHNISYKYQPSSHGSWNIYKGNVAVGDVNSVYSEEVEHPSKVQHHLPTLWQAMFSANPDAHLLVGDLCWPDHICHVCQSGVSEANLRF